MDTQKNWNLLQIKGYKASKEQNLEKMRVYVFSFRSGSDGSALPRWLKIMKSRLAGSETILRE
jgi:hypothetical protein